MTNNENIKFIYKLIDPVIMPQIKQSGFVTPSNLDVADGFIHLSTQEQYMETANLHYKDFPSVYALEIDVAPLASAIKWEPAKKRNNSFFPHLYGKLPLSTVTQIIPLTRGVDGTFSRGPALSL